MVMSAAWWVWVMQSGTAFNWFETANSGENTDGIF